MFFDEKYTVVREGTEIRLILNENLLACIVVDVTDNRLTIKSIDEKIPLEGIQTLTKYLDENFGAKQIFILSPKLQELFAQCGFRQVDPKKTDDRIRVTSFETLSKISSKTFENLKFVFGDAVRNTSAKNIQELAQGSGFLKPKIEQYEEQGYPGFQLMCDYSIPFGIKDGKDKLIAFCRVTPLNNGNYYLGDTFVDETAFDGSKKIGTAYLYQQVGKAMRSGSVFLIAPLGRVDEFEKDYKCAIPENVVFKMAGPKPKLTELWGEEKNRIQEELVSTRSYPITVDFVPDDHNWIWFSGKKKYIDELRLDARYYPIDMLCIRDRTDGNGLEIKIVEKSIEYFKSRAEDSLSRFQNCSKDALKLVEKKLTEEVVIDDKPKTSPRSGN